LAGAGDTVSANRGRSRIIPGANLGRCRRQWRSKSWQEKEALQEQILAGAGGTEGANLDRSKGHCRSKSCQEQETV